MPFLVAVRHFWRFERSRVSHILSSMTLNLFRSVSRSSLKRFSLTTFCLLSGSVERTLVSVGVFLDLIFWCGIRDIPINNKVAYKLKHWGRCWFCHTKRSYTARNHPSDSFTEHLRGGISHQIRDCANNVCGHDLYLAS